VITLRPLCRQHHHRRTPTARSSSLQHVVGTSPGFPAPPPTRRSSIAGLPPSSRPPGLIAAPDRSLTALVRVSLDPRASPAISADQARRHRRPSPAELRRRFLALASDSEGDKRGTGEQGVGFDFKTQPKKKAIKWVWIRTHKLVGPDPSQTRPSQNRSGFKGIVADPGLNG